MTRLEGLRRRVGSTAGLVVISIIALVAIAAVGVVLYVTGRNAQDKATSVQADTAPAVLTLDTLCKRNDQLGSDLRASGVCGEKIDKAKSAVEGQPQPSVPQTSGLTRDEVTSIVSAQLAGKTVTVDQVMAMVTQVYNANRPKDGPPPSADAVLAAVTQVCANGACVGPKGNDGQPGPAPTDAQLLAAVQQYCSGDKAPCVGPVGPKGDTGATGAQGQQGPQGVSVTGQHFARDSSGACHSYIDFSDGRTNVDTGTAGDAACPPVAAPPTTTTP